MFIFRCLVFFFKQKTAYEMRISDWSSDVCSSDLADRRHRPRLQQHAGGGGRRAGTRQAQAAPETAGGEPPSRQCDGGRKPRRRADPPPAGLRRSEEHTSELQSLMRISYAVFCLKKNKTDTYPKTRTITKSHTHSKN